MSAPAPAAQPFSWSKLGLAAVVLLTLALADHRIRFAFANTPNVLFWDQWDIYNPLFNGESWWHTFTYQHGPHRQGLGGLLNAALAGLTGWDARGDAVLTVAATAAAALAALPLALRCGARAGLALATVPLLFLTMRQFEAWVGPANPAHGAFPILLTMLYGLSWFMRAAHWRLAAQVLLTFLLVFTGFGLFAGALSPVLLGLEAWRARGDRRAVLLAGAAGLLTLAVWGLFFIGYKHQPAVPNFHFPHERPWEYGYFAALMLASFAGLRSHVALDLAGGAVLLLLLGAVAAIHGRRLLRAAPSAEPASAALFILAAGTLLYCLNTAIGRISLGWHDAPYAPRYIPLVAPGMLALFIQAERLASRLWRNGLWVVLFATAAWSGLTLPPGDRHAVDWYRRSRERWREVYRATDSQARANAATVTDGDFVLYPGDLTTRLEYLRRHQLNLCQPAPLY